LHDSLQRRHPQRSRGSPKQSMIEPKLRRGQQRPRQLLQSGRAVAGAALQVISHFGILFLGRHPRENAQVQLVGHRWRLLQFLEPVEQISRTRGQPAADLVPITKEQGLVKRGLERRAFRLTWLAAERGGKRSDVAGKSARDRLLSRLL